MELWELLRDNSFVGALVSGFAIIFILWLFSLCRKIYQGKRIYKILKNGLKEKNKTFLPTAYLSAESGYTQAQVEALCSHHKNIKRNEKELETWRIV